MPGRVSIMRSFSLATVHRLVASISQESLPDTLRSQAHTDDGEVMGLRHCTLPIWGVQFHPESILTPNGDRLLRNFLLGDSAA